MKHPFWLVNSSLFLFVLLTIVVLLLTKPRALRKLNFLPDIDVPLPKKETPVKDLSKIYTNDLFNTLIETPPTTNNGAIQRETMPLPPSPQPVRAALAPPPKFLEPLPVVLKGIIVAHNDDNNIAIIEKNAVSSNYKMGEKLDDAQVIRILHNKIILIRSNGQQETLYVNKLDAQEDQSLLANNNWSSVVKKITENSFSIDPQAFVHYIRSLAQFIDILNLTTVFVKGESIGCRVGRVSSTSLVYSLGLQPDDIITTINGIACNNTDERFEIYKKIITLNMGDVINVTISRASQTVSITYLLQTLTEQAVTVTTKTNPFTLNVERAPSQQEQALHVTQEKNKFNATAHSLEKNIKYSMLNHADRNSARSRNTLLNSIPL